ncbi:MAG: 50S ribosomal protein L11 methyltransferase [Prevotellaceae bacterium]|jgi:ribosomal protein L11 methyltransferase|nr:50S ribosomal protein L11 methyltransferase [Prevotellaceae bacterium]
MNYIRTSFLVDCEDFIKDIFMHNLAEIGFDGFEQTSLGLVGYCPENIFDENIVRQTVENLPFEAEIKFQFQKLENKNWNEIWEQNSFQPVFIENKVCIRGSNHKIAENVDYEIIINPKQSFGTGGHETTSMIISKMLQIDFSGKTVLDMGCGTAILSILAAKLGAKTVTAVDIDEWAVKNAEENLLLNNVQANLISGSIEKISSQKFDIIFANINRNILLEQIPFYAKMLNESGLIILSGFYSIDFEILQKKAAEHNLKVVETKENREWQMILLAHR